jgi:hypothetical protein
MVSVLTCSSSAKCRTETRMKCYLFQFAHSDRLAMEILRAKLQEIRQMRWSPSARCGTRSVHRTERTVWPAADRSGYNQSYR